MKTRVQIYLEQRQDLLLERLAKVRGVSKASLIRESIDRYVEAIPFDQDPALKLIGLAGKTGLKDLAEKHDEYLRKFERLSAGSKKTVALDSRSTRIKRQKKGHARQRSLR